MPYRSEIRDSDIRYLEAKVAAGKRYVSTPAPSTPMYGPLTIGYGLSATGGVRTRRCGPQPLSTKPPEDAR